MHSTTHNFSDQHAASKLKYAWVRSEELIRDNFTLLERTERTEWPAFLSVCDSFFGVRVSSFRQKKSSHHRLGAYLSYLYNTLKLIVKIKASKLEAFFGDNFL